MKRYLSPAIAIAVGLLVLAGYFFQNSAITLIRLTFVQWAVLLAAGAILVGVLNLFLVHLNKIIKKENDRVYSLFLLTALLFTLVYGFMNDPSDAVMVNIFNAIILPVEASLMAVMAVTLIYAAIRLLRHRPNTMSVLFLGTAVIVMLGTAPLPFYQLPFFADFIRPTIIAVLATSGARGILIGVALGTLLTGLRVLIGADRPYGGK